MDGSFLVAVWLSALFYSPASSEMSRPIITLNTSVHVALRGEDLTISYMLYKPENSSDSVMTCFDPLHQRVYKSNIPATAGLSQVFKRKIELRNLSVSGEFSCTYETEKVFWFLLVRDRGYRESPVFDFTEFITLSVLTGLLLIFSVGGSLYVFTGNRKEQITANKSTSGKQSKNREERKKRETEEDDAENNKNSSSSHYASLQPRPRSIYDVLDHSGRNREPDQVQTKPDETEPQATMRQNRAAKDKEEYESVYENFQS